MGLCGRPRPDSAAHGSIASRRFMRACGGVARATALDQAATRCDIGILDACGPLHHHWCAYRPEIVRPALETAL